MRDPAEPLRFISVTAAVDHMVSMLPLLRLSLETMKLLGDDRRKPDLYRATEGVMAMLENPDQLRERLEKLRKPDGTLEFSFAIDAADFLRKATGFSQ
jgi:hypothetical protein